MLQCPSEEREAGTGRGRVLFALFLLAAGLLVFAHGCHGDEDNELFTGARFGLDKYHARE